MEALNIIRFWKPSNGGHTENPAQPSEVASDHELDEGDDSFFDLELPLHGCEDNGNGVNGDKRFESKRKIIPIEPSSKPQSPIALLKSGPKFRVFTLRKSKSMANTSSADISDKPGLFGLPTEPPKHEKQGKTEDDSSKRLLKDLMQKYFNKFKPLYVKASKKNSLKVLGDLPVSSPVSSPASVFSAKEKQTGGRGVCKQLGKSRSTSAASSSPMSRRDDSLLLQHDGIQSAILHCKKSLNSSRESSRLSSDSSQEKLSNASSTDSSILSRVTSNSSYEKLMDSARTSGEEGNVFQHLNY
ncbi:MEMBRANE-ASSOCIATED KINASE REGULATOR 5 [Hibiscus trionum]|uniref:MEMBRANE-ASSOCIATED KINASE REGULATOR 5 n=1 Tax=Hibiscus trionum TaxID=183268 RepID=A0A9W7JFB5_HIBTR|nr:MEMBRANE-ASSOCIATED KINASE REGULATOR 5 [Hibiscus trionum]